MSDDIYRAEAWYSPEWDEIVLLFAYRFKIYFVQSMYGDEQWTSTKSFVRIGVL